MNYKALLSNVFKNKYCGPFKKSTLFLDINFNSLISSFYQDMFITTLQGSLGMHKMALFILSDPLKKQLNTCSSFTVQLLATIIFQQRSRRQFSFQKYLHIIECLTFLGEILASFALEALIVCIVLKPYFLEDLLKGLLKLNIYFQ